MDSDLAGNIDRVIEYFNKRKLDLPDAFFDRKAQFVINGQPFETLLSTAPNDPLIMMLARGPAGYRFTVKALQHAIPDVKAERGELVSAETRSQVTTRLWLSGTLRGTGEKVEALTVITLQLNDAAAVTIAEAAVDPAQLQKIREARLRA